MKDNILQECREQVQKGEAQFARGLCTKQENLNKRISIYHEACKKLAEVLSEVECDDVRAQLLSICSLQLVPRQYHPVDLGFDYLQHGGVYVFKNLRGVWQIWEDPEPEKKTFVLQLPLQAGGEQVWKEYIFRIIRRQPEESGWIGWNVYKGSGTFSGYNGGATIFLRESEGQLESVVYQKCYQNPDDPVWNCRKEETVTGYTLADMKMDNMEE